MDVYYQWLNSLINKNKSDFAEWSDANWLTPYNSGEFQVQRNHLLKKIEKSTLFKGTKPYYNTISKGCSICGEGKWSCLFITNKCNANCFYCPAPQILDEIPSTQGINFDDPTDYASYVRHFEFNGVSFSGGEPLLYFDRTLNYLRQIRSICNNNVYTWLYTNGLLIDKIDLYKLASQGLNEIRFDIGATGYNLDKIKYAKGIIPNITIEIPAVPEEKSRLIKLLPEMVKMGVKNLNLHQLRLTHHNAKNIIKKGYTIISAERPIVLESELTALEIIDQAKENDIEIGINYCSFFFKHRFQKAGFRKQIANKLTSPNAMITENGYLREFTDNSIVYKNLRLYDSIKNQMSLKNILIDNKQYYYNEIIVLKEDNLYDQYIKSISELIQKEPHEIPSDPLLFKIWQLEYIEKGLRNY